MKWNQSKHQMANHHRRVKFNFFFFFRFADCYSGRSFIATHRFPSDFCVSFLRFGQSTFDDFFFLLRHSHCYSPFLLCCCSSVCACVRRLFNNFVLLYAASPFFIVGVPLWLVSFSLIQLFILHAPLRVVRQNLFNEKQSRKKVSNEKVSQASDDDAEKKYTTVAAIHIWIGER